MRLYTEEEVIKIMEQLEVKGFNDELSTHTEELRHMEDIGIIDKLPTYITEFAQQNTLTLESKVDDDGNVLEEVKTCEGFCCSISDECEYEQYKNTPTIQQRLDNEKALRETVKKSIDKLDQIKKQYGQLDEFERGQYHTFKSIKNLLTY